jgi:branched-chain amino acid aminotransferase
MIALKVAAKEGAEDALFTNDAGHLLEFTKSNFFAVINGTLYTPKEGMLFGITRAIVLNLANELSIPIKEDLIHIKDLHLIEEAFSTSTIREILPISRINQTKLSLGPITKRLQSAFSAKVQENLSIFI